jgi:hypothetical protein
MKKEDKMKETIKSFNHLNTCIFLPVLQVFHGKISGSKMRAGMSSLRAGGSKMCAGCAPWCAFSSGKIPTKPPP